MNLFSKHILKNLLKKKKIYPKKKLGQNFLISKKILNKIIAEANLDLKDVVLEIGAGTGTLTQLLAKKVKKVIAIEKDKKIIKILKEQIKNFKNVEILQSDILKDYNLLLNKSKKYKLVANLPYYISSPIIRTFLESSNPPQLMVLIIQKEVAEKICANPPKLSKLAIFCQFYGTPKIISIVSKKFFWPQPKVDGAIIKISQIQKNLPKIDKSLFSKIVKAGFSQPRKQLLKNLARELNLSRETIKKWMLKNQINLQQRAESLTLKNWINLVKSYPCL